MGRFQDDENHRRRARDAGSPDGDRAIQRRPAPGKVSRVDMEGSRTGGDVVQLVPASGGGAPATAEPWDADEFAEAAGMSDGAAPVTIDRPAADSLQETRATIDDSPRADVAATVDDDADDASDEGRLPASIDRPAEESLVETRATIDDGAAPVERGARPRNGAAAATIDRPAAESLVENRATIDDAQPAESGWVVRARAYNARHADRVRRFNALTAGECADGDAVDPVRVARWQQDHDVAPDGRVGSATLRAARRSEASGAGTVQRKANGGDTSADVQSTAAAGVRGSGSALPHADAIQASFGRHDVSQVRAHVGGDAADAATAIGAEAYATGNDVAFAAPPSLHTAAHEAAHVVQQRGGVQLKGGVGEAGDQYEQHADAVADAVVRGESAELVLDGMLPAHRPVSEPGVQRRLAATEPTAGGIVAEPEVPVLRVGDLKAQRFRSTNRETITVSAIGDRVELVDGTRTPGSWHGQIAGRAPGSDAVRVHADIGDEVRETAVAVVVRTPVVVTQESRRIHSAGFEDPHPATLYKGDRLEVTARLADVGPAARLEGRLLTDGLLTPETSHYDPDARELTIAAVAAHEGSASAHLSITAGEGGPAIVVPAHRIEVVSPTPHVGATEPIRTANFDDAKGVTRAQIAALLTSQKVAVNQARGYLLSRDPETKIPLIGKLLLHAMQAAFSFVTGGVGTTVGKELAASINGTKAFDVDAAFTTAAKDFFKEATKSAMGKHGDRSSVSEESVVHLFCEEQALALDIVQSKLEARFENSMQPFRALEEATPGAGVAELERLRLVMANQMAWAQNEQLQQTLREWLLYKAQTSHGTAPLPGNEADPDAPRGTDLSRSGKGELRIQVSADLSDPTAPVEVRHVSTDLRREGEQAFLAHGGLVHQLGLPVVVSSSSFSIGLNEIGDLWITVSGPPRMGFGRRDVDDARRYLFTKGTGESRWQSDEHLERGIHAGARKIVQQEVGNRDLADLASHTGGWGDSR